MIASRNDETLLRAHGIRATKERTALLALLAKEKQPVSARELASRKGGRLDQVTVYRGLETLANAGLVRRVDLRHGHTDYERADTHHHHLVCTECGTIEEFEWCPDDLKIVRRSKRFSRLSDHSFELFGVCNNCA